MINDFSIEFGMDGIQYKADIVKIPFANNLPVQYHIKKIIPEIAGVELPIYFVHDPETGMFENSIIDTAPRLTNTVFNAIKKYCIENHVSLTGN